MSTTFKEYPCDLCGSGEAVEVPYARLYTNNQPIHICKLCGFVHVKSRRSPEEIADTWSDQLYGEGYTARIPAVKARQTYVADFIDLKIGLKNKDVVDIGAGEGQFMEIVKDQYAGRPFGIEPSPANCRDMRKNGFDCFEGTIEDYSDSVTDRRADIVTILWTLENCCSCREMLKGAYDLLEAGGHVAIATGSRILVPFKKPLFEYLGDHPADTHAFRFSANTLEGLLAVSGFETVYSNRYWDTDSLCIIAVKRSQDSHISWQGDNYLKVYHFFERWHQDTMFYLEPFDD
jgi:SAM-dependent methyltransferase